ncbi:MAG: hypothetical protein AABO41_05210 [Acidobacteriota bacterium]
MASLQARSPLRGGHLLLFLTKVVSFAALIVLLAAGWMAVSYLRAGLVSRESVSAGENALSTSSKPAVEKIETTAVKVKPTTAPLRLVYSCEADAEHYHTQAHLPSNCARTALSEEAAARRGLKRCLVCLPE